MVEQVELLPVTQEFRRGLAEAIRIIRETRDGFLSEQYAVDQPMSSFQERFACDQCAQAIEDEFALGTKEQEALRLATLTPASSGQDRRLTDPQRLLWREDVEGICRSPDVCWQYSKTARCGPCAIEQAKRAGVESDMSLPNLPEVYRLNRRIAELEASSGQELRAALEMLRIMAKQRKSDELDEEDAENADFDGAYDWFCDQSREIYAALQNGGGEGKS